MRKPATLTCLLGLLLVASSAAATEWRVPTDFPTIQAAIDSSAVVAGDVIIVETGSHAGAFITKAVEIRGTGGAIINAGPAHSTGMVEGFRLRPGSSGATISHLRFEVDLAVISSVGVANVTVSHNTFINCVQAVTNWGGAGWDISQNDIVGLRTYNGGGIGILIGDYMGGKTVQDNLVAHNRITGTLQVWESDGGGYNGSGIVLYSDYRGGADGGEVSFNRIIKNKVSIASDTPSVVDVVAFEMTDTRDTPAYKMIHDNAVGFNDFRDTALQIVLTPEALDTCNSISRNLGENRGHGLHPRAFLPEM